MRYSQFDLDSPAGAEKALILKKDEEILLRDFVLQKLEKNETCNTDVVFLEAQRILNVSVKGAPNGKQRLCLDRPWLYYFLTKYLKDFISVIGPGSIDED